MATVDVEIVAASLRATDRVRVLLVVVVDVDDVDVVTTTQRQRSAPTKITHQ